MHRHCHSRSIPQMENTIHCARCCKCWLFDWTMLYHSGEYNLNIVSQQFGHKSNSLMFFLLSFKSSGRSIHLEFGWFLRSFVHCVHYGHCRNGSCLLDLRWVKYTIFCCAACTLHNKVAASIQTNIKSLWQELIDFAEMLNSWLVAIQAATGAHAGAF